MILSDWALCQFKWQYLRDPQINIYDAFIERFKNQDLYPLTDETIKRKLKILTKKIRNQCVECKNTLHKKCPDRKCNYCCNNPKCAIDKEDYPQKYNTWFHRNDPIERYPRESNDYDCIDAGTPYFDNFF